MDGMLSAQSLLRGTAHTTRPCFGEPRLARAKPMSGCDHRCMCRPATKRQHGPRKLLHPPAAYKRAVDTRSIVTQAAQLDVPAFDKADLWQWRQAQLWQIARFIGPALSIPLADPIMSLVDTVCIGRCTGTLELAALGPTMLIFGLFTYIFTAITITTVSLVADKMRALDIDSAGDALSCALFVGTMCGLIIQLVLTFFSRQMVLLTGAAPALVEPSVVYLKIRAWSAPAVLVSMVAQAGLLAQQDSFAPFVWVTVQSVLNIVGDLVLITWFQQGLAGAAWATVLSQLVGTMGLMWMFTFRGQVRPKAQVPSMESVRELAGMFGPASLIYIFKSLCYMLLQGSATALKPILVAAHQVLWQVWNLCSFGHTPMEQAALAFLPGTTSRAEYQELVKLLMAVGAFVGLVTAVLATGVPYFLPSLFTPDQQLWPIMKRIAPQCASSMMLCALDVTAGGVLMACRDLLFLARVMTVSLVGLIGYFSVAKSQGWQLGGIWWGLVLFFFLRAAQTTHRVYAQHLAARHVSTVTPFESDKLQAVTLTGEAS